MKKVKLLVIFVIHIIAYATCVTHVAYAEGTEEAGLCLEADEKEAEKEISNAISAVDKATSKAKLLQALFLPKVIKVIPYIGAVMFVVGMSFGVFSIKNKGMRRYGIRLGILGVLIMFVLYISFSLYYDSIYAKEPMQLQHEEFRNTEVDMLYYDNVAILEEEGKLFILLSYDKWYVDAIEVLRKYYAEMDVLFGFVSVSIGLMYYIVTKRDRAFKRWALVGICIVIPLVLAIGHHYIAL